jgi:hypothetical protein
MQFDEKKYEQFLILHRRNKTNPEDLIERYGITLPASDAEVKAQVKAVREYWNKIGLGNSRAAAVAKWCRTQDEELRKQPGADVESATWWQRQQSERDAAAEASIQAVSDELRQTYGRLGVVTRGKLDKFAASARLTTSQAELAAQRVGLTVVGENVTLPDTAPLAGFRNLEQDMAECKAATIADLVHPGSGPFRIVVRYECLKDGSKRLDADAVEAQTTEVEKRGVSGADNARVRALRILRKAQRDGVDLRDVALYHLTAIAQDAPTSTSAKSTLERAGVESKDAATIAVLLEERAKAASVSGLDKVANLLDSGQLREAAAAAQTVSGDPAMVAEAQQLVQAQRQLLEQLLAQARTARQVPDEALAEKLLKDVAQVSAEDAATELAMLPLAAPVQLRAVGDGAQVKLFWQRGPGQDQATVYAVCRTPGRVPTAPTDGVQVYRGPGDSCADPGAPVARPVRYGVFALGDRRPPSRPDTAEEVTLLPPVSQLKAEVDTATIALSWSAHPDAVVRVTRAAPGADPVPVPATGNGCQLSGLPEGKPQHFEAVAVYRGPGGAELCSLPEQITATPRAQAEPIPKLRARAFESGGVVRVRVTWPRIDNSDVKIIRSDTEPAWPFGTMVTAEQMARAGDELTGRAVTSGAETGFETDLPAGVHYLLPLSVGGTGIAVGRTATVAVTDPVTHLTATPFSDYATVSWAWPSTAHLAEVTWELDGEVDVFLMSLADYRSQGGARVPLGTGPCKVEVRAVIMAGGKRHAAPSASITVDKVVALPVRYQVSGLPAVGPFGGRAKKVVFTSEQACAGVRVRMVAFPGRVLPTKATDGVPVLEAMLTLAPGVPAEHKVSIPKSVKRPFWVRCFVVEGHARLIDPPIGSLKEA